MVVGAATRIAVIGTSGAGKTTLARTIAGRLGLPQTEPDAINSQPGWRDLDRHDRPEFAHLVVLRLRRPAEAARVLIRLQADGAAIARRYP